MKIKKKTFSYEIQVMFFRRFFHDFLRLKQQTTSVQMYAPVCLSFSLPAHRVSFRYTNNVNSWWLQGCLEIKRMPTPCGDIISSHSLESHCFQVEPGICAKIGRREEGVDCSFGHGGLWHANHSRSCVWTSLTLSRQSWQEKLNNKMKRNPPERADEKLFTWIDR